MTFRLYRKQLGGDDFSGIEEDGQIYNSGVLDKYRPIKNEEHLELMIRAYGGLEWGMLDGFTSLVASGYDIPECIRNLFAQLVNGESPYGYHVTVTLNPKFSGHESRTPAMRSMARARDLNLWTEYNYERGGIYTEHSGKPKMNRTEAMYLRCDLYKKCKAKGGIYDISKETYDKIVGGKKPI